MLMWISGSCTGCSAGCPGLERGQNNFGVQGVWRGHRQHVEVGEVAQELRKCALLAAVRSECHDVVMRHRPSRGNPVPYRGLNGCRAAASGDVCSAGHLRPRLRTVQASQ